MHFTADADAPEHSCQQPDYSAMRQRCEINIIGTLESLDHELHVQGGLVLQHACVHESVQDMA